MTTHQTIQVIGVGAISPFGCGAHTLFEGLCRNRNTFVRYQPFVDAGLKHPFASPIPPSVTAQIPSVDPSAPPMASTDQRDTQLLAYVVGQALTSATQSPDLSNLTVPAQRIGLFVGTSGGGLGAFSQLIASKHVTTIHKSSRNPAHITVARYHAGTHHVAQHFGFGGPVQVICTACASGSQAIAQACDWLQCRAVDVAIAAGYDALHPFVGAGFDALGATADCAMPFSQHRSGLVLGEAAAAVVLTREGVLPAKPLGHITAWACASDAYHLTSPHPQGRGVAQAIRRAMHQADLTQANLAAVSAHGTSTVYNDCMEAAALCDVFGEKGGNLPVYTVKGTIGHTLGAAGALEAVVAIESMQRGIIPPTCTEPPLDPRCNVNLIVEPTPCPRTTTLSISAGFGGANCVLAISAALS